MKFAIVVVLVALALGAQSSVVPISLVQGPAVHVVPHHAGSVAIQASAIPAVVHAAPLIASPVVVAHSVAHPAVVVAAPAEGTYVAKTRGAVHVAPLPGHSQSAASVNLEPAPGTV